MEDGTEGSAKKPKLDENIDDKINSHTESNSPNNTDSDLNIKDENSVEENDKEQNIGSEEVDHVDSDEDVEDVYLDVGWDEEIVGWEEDNVGSDKEAMLLNPFDFPLVSFSMAEEFPLSHKFSNQKISFSPAFLAAYNRDLKILKDNLPKGIWVQSYEGRIDCLSALMAGPPGTPYEGFLFAFEIGLPENYPNSPPNFHYKSFHRNRINPNLYTEGKVCVSILGTWGAQHESERWNEKTSSLLQILVSIQGLILVPEPFFNEPGHLMYLGTRDGSEMSRGYNEMIILSLLEAADSMLLNPTSPWKKEITSFMKAFNEQHFSLTLFVNLFEKLSSD